MPSLTLPHSSPRSCSVPLYGRSSLPNCEISPCAGNGNASKLQVGTIGAGEKCHWEGEEEEEEELVSSREHIHPVILLRFLLLSYAVGSSGGF